MGNKKFLFFLFSFCILGFSSSTVFGAVSTIDPVDHYAWNDIIGWIDFYNTPGTIYVSSTTMTGYADSSIGEISFDCATSPTPPADCEASFPDWKITRSGTDLSGWAWNEDVGWISFDCHDNPDDPNCISTNYQVTLVDGEFLGWAWNDIIGWISFNCSDPGVCAESDYKVKYTPEVATTASLISSTFDTGLAGGVVYNTIMYQGVKPTGTEVKFQLATSNCSNGATNAPLCTTNIGWGGVKVSGDGAFLGYDGTSSTYYSPLNANVPAAINSSFHNNKRYFRYKIFMTSDVYRDQTPRIDQVIVNWSR